MSWSIAFGVSVVVAAFIFLPRVIPGYRPRPGYSRERLRPMFGFSIGNWVAGVIGSGGSLLLPLLIINTLRPIGTGAAVITSSDSTAVYYAATVVAGSLSAIPAATMTSFYAEASQRNAARRRDERRAIGLSLALLLPGILALWFLADTLLRILFDLRPELADLGTPALQILGLASIPIFLNTVFGTRVRIRKQVAPSIVSAAILTATTLILGYLFLTWYSLPGLAWAVVLGNAAATPYLFLSVVIQPKDATLAPLLVAASLASLIRVFSLAVPRYNFLGLQGPGAETDPLNTLPWLALVSVPLLVSIGTVAYVQRLRPSDLGLLFERWVDFPVQAGVAMTGIPLGLLEFAILQIPPSQYWTHEMTLGSLVFGGLAIFFATGLSEEPIFRAILLKRPFQ